MDLRTLQVLRLAHYRISPTHRIRTPQAAARFIQRVGFCWLFAPARRTLELPALFEAVKGRYDVHIEDWDADSDRLWVWKSDLPAARLAYYGKALAGRPGFVSLELLPALLAALGQDDVERAYTHGATSYDAHRIYRVLAQSGPQPTVSLRRAAGFDGRDGGTRYHRALDELQKSLVVMPIGATNEVGNWPSQIFELVARWFPEQSAAAHRLDIHTARRQLITRYVRTVIAAPVEAVGRLFDIPRGELKELVDSLAEERELHLQEGWLLDRPRRSLNGAAERTRKMPAPMRARGGRGG